MPKPPILIYGSCVSRDMQRISENRFNLLGYIARQSLISAFSTPLSEPASTGLNSKFLDRCIRGDFASNLRDQMLAYAPKARRIVVDFASDRHGVLEVEGSYVSRTSEIVNSGVLKNYSVGKWIKFDTPEHRALFRLAALEFKKFLMEKRFFKNVSILRFNFTDASADGQPVPKTRGQSAAEINESYEWYYRKLEGMGFDIIDLPQNLALTHSKHRWGASQDHFIDEAYLFWADAIAEKIQRTSEKYPKFP